MTTRLLLTSLAAFLACAAAAQSADSLSCVTMTTTNGQQHLVQVVSERPYFFNVQFCDDPTGRVTEVPKAQVQALDPREIQVGLSKPPAVTVVDATPPALKTSPPALAERRSNAATRLSPRRHWVALLVKAPLWSRYEVNAQAFVFPHVAAGVGLQKWSVDRTRSKTTFIGDNPYTTRNVNDGSRQVYFVRLYSNPTDGAYLSAGYVKGRHHLYSGVDGNNTSSSDNYGSGMGGLNWNFNLFTVHDSEESADVSLTGAEIRLGYAKVVQKHLLLDAGASFTPVRVKYLERSNNYDYNPIPVWLHLMLGVTF